MLRHPLTAALIAVLIASPARGEPAATSVVEVFKSPTCTCCTAWMAHMTDAGFKLEARDMVNSDLNRLKIRLGLKPEQSSCHTAIIDGYVIEGHVPADDVRRLLAEKPDAAGLAAPGMPLGSPGMEDDGPKEPYDVLLIRKDGTSEVFAKH